MRFSREGWKFIRHTVIQIVNIKNENTIAEELSIARKSFSHFKKHCKLWIILDKSGFKMFMP
jgi:hypothetical protein